MKFGFVGCGRMARYHADVVQALGHSIAVVCTTGDSARRHEFVRDYGVTRTCDHLEDLLADPPDAAIIATPWDRTADVAEPLMAAGIPSLIEKPVALTAKRLAGWLDADPPLGERSLVGYNRRFYEFMPEVVEAVATHPLLSVEASFPDRLTTDLVESSSWSSPVGLLYRTSHFLDLLLYLLGDLDVDRMHRHGAQPRGGHAAYNGLLVARSSGVPVHLQINFDAPSQHRLSLNFEDRVYRLSPIETLTVCDGLDQLEPTPDWPIRRYVPRVVATREADLAYKPGLRRQLEHFTATCVDRSRPNTVGCTLTEALRVTRLCEAIAG